MSPRKIVITTIFPPSPSVIEFSRLADVDLIVVGDKKTPDDWSLLAADYFGWNDHRLAVHRSQKTAPFNHYSRKNLGYLQAMAAGASEIIDTDDDNFPLASFGFPATNLRAQCTEPFLGFINPYNFFSTDHIWPRGLPLAQILRNDSDLPLQTEEVQVGVWQGLANGDPDVDALYRLTNNSPCTFENRDPVVLAEGTWSPFNSQNTMFRREVFPLLYLPVSVSFRFTDILRSFVAQPIMWNAGYRLGFSTATVFQDRNTHDYLEDFQSEIPMYLASDRLNQVLVESQGAGTSILGGLRLAYEALARENIVAVEELASVEAWIDDCESLGYE